MNARGRLEGGKKMTDNMRRQKEEMGEKLKKLSNDSRQEKVKERNPRKEKRKKGTKEAS